MKTARSALKTLVLLGSLVAASAALAGPPQSCDSRHPDAHGRGRYRRVRPAYTRVCGYSGWTYTPPPPAYWYVSPPPPPPPVVYCPPPPPPVVYCPPPPPPPPVCYPVVRPGFQVVLSF